MRTGLLLSAAIALLIPATASAADPPIVYQTQPAGRLLEEARTAANLLGGDKAVTALNEQMKKMLGEKGFEGLDLNRPIVGYINVPADPKDTVAVIAFPVTGEKEFVALCERLNGVKPKSLDGGLYELPPAAPKLKAVMRVHNGYAYIATALKDPTATLDANALVPVAKLIDPTDRALATGRIYFDRIPAEVRTMIVDALKVAGKSLEGAQGEFAVLGKDLFAQFSKLGTRYLELSKDAKELALRLNLDPATGNVSAELSLTAKPGTPLDKIIANKKAGTNRFAGVLTPDTMGGAIFSLPLFNDELRIAAVVGLEELRKKAANEAPPVGRAALDELLKGLIRTAKSGDCDVAVSMRGPDKNGLYTAIQAYSFDDPSGLEKELKKLVEAQVPAEFKGAIKWDAAKAGTVSIHTVDLAKLGPWVDERQKRVFGENMSMAVAFAPKVIVYAIGPDPVAAVKGVLAQKPAPAAALDVVVNTERLNKFLAAIADEQVAGKVAEFLGKEDKLISAMSLSVGGGKELKITLALNLKILPRAISQFFLVGSESRVIEKR